MDFITTARMLMDFAKSHPESRYSFQNGHVLISIPVEENVPKLFDDAKAMFEPV